MKEKLKKTSGKRIDLAIKISGARQASQKADSFTHIHCL